jgi:hypothetical protein
VRQYIMYQKMTWAFLVLTIDMSGMSYYVRPWMIQ